MKRALFILILAAVGLNAYSQIDPAATLWYAKPADKWAEALPIGNGRLGAMIFGGVADERIPEIQELLFEDRNIEAHHLFGRFLLGYPVEQQKYQSMGNVVLDFKDKAPAEDYRRELDLRTGITRISYAQSGAHFTREAFVSHPDQVIVLRIAADRPGAVGFEVELRGVRNQAHSNYATDYFQMDLDGPDGLKLVGKGADYLGIEGKIRYEARLRVRLKGGRVKTGIKSLIVEGADEAVIVLIARTNFVSYKDVSGDAAARAADDLARLANRDYAGLRADHVKDHQALFDRVKLELPAGPNSLLPTDVRLQKIQTQPDPALAALCYQFGRYVLIASSRPGTQAANLQGIWNDDANPSWDSKYTTNINLQMNYWVADAANLGECSLPLFNLIREATDQGRDVAREHYGAGGWVLHQNTDQWRVAAPMDGANWGGFTTGGAWLCTHIWEHFAATRDKGFLKEYYPVMKGSAEFFLDFLTPDPKRGWLVTNPSTSPENSPASPGNTAFFDEINAVVFKSDPGTKLCYGSTIDTQILLDLFREVAQASEVLGEDAVFRDKVLKARARLAPMQVGKDGALQEWIEDWPQSEKQHRHLSPLYGLYPGHVISPEKTPDLIGPAKKVLEQRGDGGAGWSMAWKMDLWARLADGNRAEKIFLGYLKNQCYPTLFAKCGTPMQIDGTMGVSSAVTEMLVQSNEGYIRLLPALPDAWAEKGRFSGVVARGAFELDYSWASGRVQTIKLTSKAGETCRLRSAGELRVTFGSKTIPVQKDRNGIFAFPTTAGGVYAIEMK